MKSSSYPNATSSSNFFNQQNQNNNQSQTNNKPQSNNIDINLSEYGWFEKNIN
jgi:hypothetical protein